MTRDSKGRFCKEVKKEPKYQEKLKKTIKFILDNITIRHSHKKDKVYALDLTVEGTRAIELNENTWNDLRTAYNILK